MTTIQLAPQHHNLSDIDDVERFNPDRDQPLFDDLKSVLAKHNALSRFGVCLLHRHFDVFEGEMLVEFCDADNRVLTTRPVRDEEISGDSFIETNWRLDTGAVNQACIIKCMTTAGKHSHTVHSKR